MEEQVFLQANGMLVTSSRIEINGQTFATRNVGSVKVVAPGISILAVFVAIVGAISLANGSVIFGACCAVVGGIWAYTTAVKRKVMIVAGGGEVLALETSDSPLAEKLRSSIAQAISVR